MNLLYQNVNTYLARRLCLGGEAAFRHSLKNTATRTMGEKKHCAQAASSRLDFLCKHAELVEACVKTRKYGVADNHE